MSKKAFTLIELLIVITIIALLLGVVFIAYGNAKKKGQVAKAQSDMNTLVSALKLFQNEKGKLPASDDGWSVIVDHTLVPERYLETPIYNDPWGNQYHYTCGSGGASIIWSCGAKGDSTTCSLPDSCDGQFCGDKKFNDSFGYVVAPAPSSCL
ncbi:MAG: general secretion pathway protein G [Candidatus Berkelbacteria bacterium Athens1014_28]|uniref:General secretion pathway protein G n=1 Tax=Candidatus Berkelbacteria bacterium Athens1014_28 TaxID=2017145 RepID=A0A554LIV6_9BACT|nr:MAG: general secretion pathway protein G [Candidatus Berkelbacteria bacterium Athens1014_28]